MRSNSGKDKSRNNLRDPTLRDRDLGRVPTPRGKAKTVEMGSAARKTGQRGADR